MSISPKKYKVYIQHFYLFMFQTANDAVEERVREEASRKRKRGAYCTYDDETRAKIARYAIDNGVMKASRKFTTDLGTKVNESTVRSIKASYLKAKKTCTCPRTPTSPCDAS